MPRKSQKPDNPASKKPAPKPRSISKKSQSQSPSAASSLSKRSPVIGGDASACDLEKLELTEKLRITLDYTYDWEYWIAPDGIILYMSPSCKRITGHKREDFIKNPALLDEIVHPDDRSIIAGHNESIDQGPPFIARYRILSKKGGIRWIEHVCQAVFSEDGKWLGRRASNRDITEQKQAEEKVLSINRELRAISDCNQVMVRAKTEKELCKAVCTIMCDVAGYRMAWVGVAEHDKAKTVRPCGWGGYEEGYLTDSKFTWADNELGRGPTGLAIRTGKVHFMQDFDSVPSGAPWRKAALERGYRSSITLPLKDPNGKTYAAFMLYADRPNAFVPEEVKLLEELAGDLAFGIMAIRDRDERRKAEEVLLEREHLLSRMAELNPAVVSISEIGGKELYSSRSFFSDLGYKTEEIKDIQKFAITIIDPEDFQKFLLAAEELKGVTDDNVRRVEARIKDAKGNWRWFQILYIVFKRDKAGLPSQTMSVVREITDLKLTEATLRETKDFLENLLNYANAPIIVWDPKFKITRFNQAFEHLTGLKASEVIGKSLELLFPPESKESSLARVNGATKGDRWEVVEIPIQYIDGSVRTVLWNSATLYDGDGRIPIATIAQGQDITERKMAEEALRQSQHDLQRAQAVGKIGSWRLDLAKNELIWSEETYRMFGIPSSTPMTYEYFLATIHPDDRKLVDDSWNAALAGEPYDCVHRIVVGKEIKWVREKAELDIDEEGKLAAGFGTVQDITERKTTEEQIQKLLTSVQEEKEKLSTLINSIPDEVWFADINKNFTLANPAAVHEFGLASADADVEELAKSLEVFRPDGSPRPLEEAPPLKALNGEIIRNQEEFIRTPATGELRYRQVSAVPVKDADGNIIGSVSVVRDITERKEAEEKLRKSEERFRSLFTSMSEGVCEHELIYNKKGKPVDYRILECNPTYEAITQIPREQAVGKTATELYGTGEPPYFDIYVNVAESGEPAYFETYFPPMGKHFSISVFSPGKGRFVTVFQDVTERKRQQEVINGLAKFPEENPNAVLRVTHDGTLTYHNSGSEPLLRYWKIKTGEKLTGKAMANLIDAVQNNKVVEEEITINGTYLSCLYVPIKNVDYLNIYCRDITERKQAEDAVLAEKRLTDKIIDSLPGVFYLFDEQGQFLRWNKNFETVTGLATEEFSLVHVLDLFNGENKTLIAERIGETFTKGFSHADAELTVKDGRTIPYYFTGKKIVVDHKNCLVGMGIDVSELKNTMFALRETRDYLQNLFDYANAPIIVWDPDYQITRFNSAFEHLTGRKASDVIGKKLDLLFPVDNRKHAMKYVNGTFKGDRWEVVEIPILHKDGSIRTVLWNSATLYDADGTTVIATIAQGQDITERKQAEEALHKAHAMLEAVTSGTEVIIAAIDQDYRYIFFNQAYKEEMVRLTGKEITIGMSMKAMLADMPEQLQIAIEQWTDVLDGQTTQRMVKFGDPEKYQRIYNVHHVPLLTSSGAVFGAGEAALDVTELEQARAALQKAHDELEHRVEERTGELILANTALGKERQRFQEVLDMLPVYIILLDKNYHVPFDNKFFRERFGESGGKRCFEYLFNRTEACEVCETYKVYDKNGPLEWEWTGPDGHNYYIYDFPFTDTDGSELIMEVGIDITERKKAELALKQAHDELEIRVEERTRELKETRDYLENLINTANAPIIVWDPNYRITRFNQAFERLTGRSSDEMLGQSLDILFSEESREHSMEHITSVTQGKRLEVEEIPIQNVDGSVRTVLWNSATLFGEDGAVIATIAQGMDITERKLAEAALVQRTEDLEQANRELEAFSYSVSHDLRAPLRSIDGFSQLIMRRYADKLDEKGKDYLDELRHSSQLMAQLMDDILTLSRISRYELTRNPVDLSALAIAVAKEIKKSQPEHGAEFVIAHDLATKGDERLLKIVLENLMGNAYKFTGRTKKAKIELGITKVEGTKVFFVRDNGVGFDMQFADKLFKPFHRLHTPKEFPGTGIGLASVRRIIERHGGRIWAEGELEKGATFYFTLPG